MRRGLLTAIAVFSGVALLCAQEASQPSLDLVLRRAGNYVAEYQKGLRGIVAEETYYQNFTSRNSPGARGRLTREGRQLRSDVLMVKLGDAERWLQFRDVFEVDRHPVRDRDQRLYKLFVDPKHDAQAQAEAIQLESARYNIGPVMRTINVPMLALFFFDRAWAAGVHYSLAEQGNVKKFSALAPPNAISVVEFKETTKETAVRGERGRGMPSRGKAWIDHTDGRILQTEMTTQDTALTATIVVTYRSEEGLLILVPEEMREIYTIVRNDTRIDGRARYAKFRQFMVTTSEKPK
jgi:hypothetical protein